MLHAWLKGLYAGWLGVRTHTQLQGARLMQRDFMCNFALNPWEKTQGVTCLHSQSNTADLVSNILLLSLGSPLRSAPAPPVVNSGSPGHSRVCFPAVLVLLILSMRRHRKQPYIIDDDENIHENIVRYDDEGGGEEDTEAFDIAAMWNPREAQVGGAAKTRQDMLPEIESLSRYVPQTCAVSSTVHSYVLAKLYEADMDLWAPPFDSLQTYMFEGDGSVAGSLSSLQSATSDSEQSFDFLTDWGPRFRKLAELYGASEGAPLW